MEQRRIADHEQFAPRILSEEEIDLYLKGDGREIDRLILYSINRVSAALIDHMQLENVRDAHLQQIGGFDSVIVRIKFIDSLIEKNNKHIRMMEKVESSGLIWAFLAFLGLIAVATWEYIRTKL